MTTANPWLLKLMNPSSFIGSITEGSGTSGVECGTGRCFLVTVPDRCAKTLRAQVECWILPGTHIVSDAWAAYAHLEQWNNNIYTHTVVIH